MMLRKEEDASSNEHNLIRRDALLRVPNFSYQGKIGRAEARPSEPSVILNRVDDEGPLNCKFVRPFIWVTATAIEGSLAVCCGSG